MVILVMALYTLILLLVTSYGDDNRSAAYCKGMVILDADVDGNGDS